MISLKYSVSTMLMVVVGQETEVCIFPAAFDLTTGYIAWISS